MAEEERVLESVRMETDPHRPPSGRTGVLTVGGRFRSNPACTEYSERILLRVLVLVH